MKFAKELDQDAVPEWRAQYLNYKQGKKKLKAVLRALRSADQTPRSVEKTIRGEPTKRASSRNLDSGPQDLRAIEDGVGVAATTHGRSRRPTETGAPTERSPLSAQDVLRRPGHDGMTRYGSIIGSPTRNPNPAIDSLNRSLAEEASTLELPNPWLEAEQSRGPTSQWGHTGNAYEINPPRDVPGLDGANQHARILQAPRLRSVFRPKRVNSLPSATEHSKRPFMKRIFSMKGGPSREQTDNDVALEAYLEVDFRQAEFFAFLDKELEKVESFYLAKENEATDRLGALREQLHVMRAQRLGEIVEAKRKKNHAENPAGEGKGSHPGTHGGFRPRLPRLASAPFVGTAVEHIDHALAKVRRPNRFGPTSAAMGELGSPEIQSTDPRTSDSGRRRQNPDESRRDYVRHHNVPYRVAKRKLKVAMAEHYRSLEQLKSYSSTNRTAFRKINKKYDKATNARPGLRYVTEHVDHAHFDKSDVIDNHMQTVEDLYARYFERGNHKFAVNKLRARVKDDIDYTGSSMRLGLLAGTGLLMAIMGVISGARLLFEATPDIKEQTAYLLQLYGGYFLALLLVGLFVLDCKIFATARVNYQFIFEFDPRHVLDWRQLAEIPATFMFLLGLVMLLNFERIGGEIMYIYWPVILVGISVVLMCLPAPYFYWRSRGWFLDSNFRLLTAGVTGVEFRDFFLGDMFCSLTYAMGNISLFFCLYAHHWSSPSQCNSSNSRLLGFFTALPGIWRAIQCIRRYCDTRKAFPHLVNCGKYTFTILSYMSISLFRIDKQTSYFTAFVVFNTINSLYCSVWDIAMDWSLGDLYAKHTFLRPTLAYKSPALYYFAIVVDPILRFNWIIYAIFRNDIQHSGIIAFSLAASEVLRRGLWSLFRVENEHCTNMGRFRASRDVPLPYTLDGGSDSPSAELLGNQQNMGHAGAVKTDTQNHTGEANHPGEAIDTSAALNPADSHVSGADLEAGRRSSSMSQSRIGRSVTAAVSSLRRRNTPKSPKDSPRGGDTPTLAALKRVGTTMATAHSEDYVRKRDKYNADGRYDPRDPVMDDYDEDDDEMDEEINRSESEDSDGEDYDVPAINDRPGEAREGDGADGQERSVNSSRRTRRDRPGTEWASRGPMGEAGEGGS
ncbi:hypothetical protein MBLNU230_g4796t1 [Neophaeotheca triangularis]